MQRMVLDRYLRIEENQMVYDLLLEDVLMGSRSSIHLFIYAEPQAGKTHILRELVGRIEGVSLGKRNSQNKVLYYTGESLYNLFQFIARQRRRSDNQPLLPLEETTEPIIIIDDIHLYPLQKQGASVLLKDFLKGSKRVIVTSNLPLEKAGAIFKHFTEIKMFRPSLASTEKILLDFVQQYHIRRISTIMIRVCGECYEERLASLSELKDILFKCKKLADSRIKRTLHDLDFCHFFEELGLDGVVHKKVTERLIAKEKSIKEQLKKKE